jgi:hypothetical protein
MKLSSILFRMGAPLLLLATAASAQFKVTGVSALSNGATTPLESTVGAPGKAESNVLKSAVGLYSSTQGFKIAGEKSPVRVAPAAALLIAVEMTPGFQLESVVPLIAGGVQLRLLAHKKGEREFQTTGNDAKNVRVNVVVQDAHTFKVTPNLALLPGEYALTLLEEVSADDQRYTGAPVKAGERRFRMYCFGVD